MGDYAIYRSQRRGAGYSVPVKAPGVDVDAPADDAGPVVTPDELDVFFASTCPGGAGCYDIYEATRDSVADGFVAAGPVAELNTASRDVANWISPDACTLYFTRLESDVGYQRYRASRPSM